MSTRTAWLVGGSAATILYFLLPSGGTWQAAVFVALLAASVALVGTRLRDRALPPVAGILFTGQLVYLAATAAWYVLPLALRPQPFPSFVDGLFFGAYAIFGVFLFALVRTKRDRDHGHLFDVLVITISLFALAWRYVIQPALDTPGASTAARVTGVAYPLVQMALLALAVRLDLLAAFRNPAEVALAVWIAGELAADAGYGLTSAQGSFTFGHPLSLGWMVSYIAIGAFALHPDAPAVLRPRRDDRAPSVTRRLTVLGIASLAPLVVLVASPEHSRDELLVIGLASAISFVLVLYRVSRLTVDVMEQRRLTGRLEDMAHELRRQAFRDPLTGLANRVLFTERLTEALRSRRSENESLAVLLVDLDAFKQVNDSMGHEAGDELLLEVAARLASAVRPGDIVARPGGDEFAVLLDPVDADSALRVAGRVVERLRQPHTLRARTVRPVASVGVALADAPLDAEALMRQADVAMYAAKSAGGDRWEAYAVERHRTVLDRQRLEMELRDVAERGELVLHYQPIFELATRRLVGCEALLRWQHPERGLLYPGAFIEAAEESGAIVPMGLFVLEEACHQVMRWVDALPTPIHVSVNLSRRQLHDTDVVESVESVLRKTGVRRDLVTLELTETALMEDTGTMSGLLERLKALGVGLSMDDFGTGYSSLSDLRRLPVDIIKVDRVFVDGIAREHAEWSLTVAILQLASTLGKRTLAEGIETAPQLAHLRALGCEMGQGFLLARPMPVEDFERTVLGEARRMAERA
ncbi:MAG TPA: EAL domain-containing protein [Acidimicrobiales bacterium]|nr:EAL domain-containing protein [Acidimicrobiales bacterium]